MNLFSKDFLDSLKFSIIEIIKDAVAALVKSQGAETRYLQKKAAKKYVGGVNDKGFERLVDNGLPEIRIDGMLRYDKQDIDEFMEKYKS
ncbi:hypothetical protein [Enterococcus larvae]|uniref:hypothetical protein n=1 Tax=Enterococcus larvae TaxID=2794352 RepID=UPI003F3211BF